MLNATIPHERCTALFRVTFSDETSDLFLEGLYLDSSAHRERLLFVEQVTHRNAINLIIQDAREQFDDHLLPPLLINPVLELRVH